MTQRQLNRAVAKATGETIDTVNTMGFSIAYPRQVCHDPEPSDFEEKIIDWDRYERRRNVPIAPQRSRRAVLV